MVYWEGGVDIVKEGLLLPQYSSVLILSHLAIYFTDCKQCLDVNIFHCRVQKKPYVDRAVLRGI